MVSNKMRPSRLILVEAVKETLQLTHFVDMKQPRSTFGLLFSDARHVSTAASTHTRTRTEIVKKFPKRDNAHVGRERKWRVENREGPGAPMNVDVRAKKKKKKKKKRKRKKKKLGFNERSVKRQ